MLGRVIAGAGAVVLNVLLTKMVADWFHDRHLASATAILIVSWPFGVGLALVVLGPLAVAASWNLAVQVTAWVCIVALLAVLLVYRTPPRSGAASHSPSSLTRRDLAVALAAGLIWTFYNAAYILVVSFTPALLTARGAALSNAAVLASFATWPLIVSVPLGGYLADRTGRGQDIMVASLLGMALTMPAVLLVPSPLAALAVFGLVGGLAGGIIAALPGQALSSHARHLGLGIFFTLYYAGMALLPALAGWLRDRLQYDAAPFAFGSLLAVLAAALGFAFRRVARAP
jgi:MFS family permease